MLKIFFCCLHVSFFFSFFSVIGTKPYDVVSSELYPSIFLGIVPLLVFIPVISVGIFGQFHLASFHLP